MKPFLQTADQMLGNDDAPETVTRMQVTQMIEDRIGVSLHR